MTLSVIQPTDSEQNSRWPYWIRTLAAAINAIEGGSSSITITEVSMSAGDTALVVGVDISALKIEVILLSSIGATTLTYIRGGTEGQIKIIIFVDNDVTVQDGVESDGKIYLNQVALTTTNFLQGDVLVLVNIDGDGGSTYGYWKEIWRMISVK